MMPVKISVRAWLAGVVALWCGLLMASCAGKDKTTATLVVHWSEAPRDTTLQLLVSYTDTLRQPGCDTLFIDKPKGKAKCTLGIYPVGVSPVSVMPMDGSFVVLLDAAPARKITLRLPLAHPSAARIKGYKEVAVSDRFTASQRTLLYAYDDAVAQGNVQAADSLYQLIEEAAARFVANNKDKEGVALLANRYFGDYGSMARFMHCTGDTVLPVSLPLQRMLLGELLKPKADRYLVTSYRPLGDTIQAIDAKYPTRDSALTVLLLDRCLPAKGVLDSLKRIGRDTLAQRKLYTILVYPSDRIAEPLKATKRDSIPPVVTLTPPLAEWYGIMRSNAFATTPCYILLKGGKMRFTTEDQTVFLDTLRRELPYKPRRSATPKTSPKK